MYDGFRKEVEEILKKYGMNIETLVGSRFRLLLKFRIKDIIRTVSLIYGRIESVEANEFHLRIYINHPSIGIPSLDDNDQLTSAREEKIDYIGYDAENKNWLLYTTKMLSVEEAKNLKCVEIPKVYLIEFELVDKIEKSRRRN